MKYLLTILSVYFLLLSAAPCSDGEAQVISSAPHSHEQEHDHTRHADGCSPFCSCSCCSVNVVTIDIFHVDLGSVPTIDLSRLDILKTYHLLGSYDTSIWQPPKV